MVCGLDVSDMIRTRDLLIRSQTLYPAELHSHIRFEQNIYYSKVFEMSSTFLKKFKKFLRGVKRVFYHVFFWKGIVDFSAIKGIFVIYYSIRENRKEEAE